VLFPLCTALSGGMDSPLGPMGLRAEVEKLLEFSLPVQFRDELLFFAWPFYCCPYISVVALDTIKDSADVEKGTMDISYNRSRYNVHIPRQKLRELLIENIAPDKIR
jgi:hypothetical protein